MIKKFFVAITLGFVLVIASGQISKANAAEIYVGSYSDDTSVYLLTNTVFIRSYRPYSFNCKVRAGYDLLSYNFYPVNGSV